MPKTKKGKYQNREVYLNAALDIIREEGVERLTMRHLAETLDVSAMAVYKHFPNKKELLKALLDAFIARSDVLPDKHLPWQDWVHHVAEKMFAALQGETIWLTVLGSMDIGEKALEVTQAFLTRLTDEGFDNLAALEAYLAMLQVVMGSALLQASITQHQEKALMAANGAFGEAKGKQLLQRSQVELGLSFLIAGMEKRHQATTLTP